MAARASGTSARASLSGSAASVHAIPAPMYATRPSLVASRFSGWSLFVCTYTSGQSGRHDLCPHARAQHDLLLREQARPVRLRLALRDHEREAVVELVR